MRLTGATPSSPQVWIQPTRIQANVEMAGLGDENDLLGQVDDLCTPADILIADILTAEEVSLLEGVSMSSPIPTLELEHGFPASSPGYPDNPFSLTPTRYRNNSPLISSPAPGLPPFRASTPVRSLPFASPPSPTPVRATSPLCLASSPVPSVRPASPASSEILIVTPPRPHQAVMKVKDILGSFALASNCGPLRIDTQVLSVLKDHADSLPSVQGPHNATRLFDGSVQQGLGSFYIEARDLQRLQSPDRQLNDVCINMSALVMQRSLVDTPRVRSCAVLPLYIISSTGLDGLWRVTQPTLYWQRSV